MEDVFGEYKDILRRRPDLTKAKEILGYVPKTNMEEAIKKMIEQRRNEIQKNNSNYNFPNRENQQSHQEITVS
jgi:hypothetical protein